MAYRLHSANTLKRGCAMVADQAPITDREQLAERIAVGTSNQTELTAHAVSC